MQNKTGQDRLRYIGLPETTGYGVAGAALVAALRELGIDVIWETLHQVKDPMAEFRRSHDLGQAPRTIAPVSNSVTIIHAVPEYYPALIARERWRGVERIIGHSVWETDRLPQHWPALINQLDAIIVPTELNKQIFQSSNVTIPIVVVPHLPSAQMLKPTSIGRDTLRARLPNLDDRFCFYTVSTWLERKGIAPLIEAFVAAFSYDDPVALIIKTTPLDFEKIQPEDGLPLEVWPQFAAMQRAAFLREGRIPPPIYLLTDELTETEMHALHEMGDCYVSLSRAEGWGLGSFEAARAGKPVITTGWGGPTAYLAADDAYFVDWSLQPVRPGEPNASYTPDQNWAEPNIASAVAALRHVFADPGEAARRGMRAAQRIRGTIAPETEARKLCRMMFSVQGEENTSLSPSDE